MRRRITPLLVALAAACCTAAAPAPQQHTAAPAPPPLTVMVGDTDTLGRILTDSEGRTLYRYDLEHDGTVVCVASCTATRKPLLTRLGTELRLPPGIAGTLGTVSRPDGGDQVTYNGSPLYLFTGDAKPSDTNGVTLDWHVLQPRDAPTARAAQTAGAARAGSRAGGDPGKASPRSRSVRARPPSPPASVPRA
ncbi:hypothetical protein N8I84_37655 [Streptomyces cynarae]|uniref:Lipoprotein n=1 Tax=Streptomyces cynarae TaxID=2981134 RepID=A0ABY6EAR0_9ACTN|nr:hypothetical protein [Streptomyces cynarae]UXY23785.1 hypothetical protein N8I84_37655 [Streptomyces cynarae]